MKMKVLENNELISKAISPPALPKGEYQLHDFENTMISVISALEVGDEHGRYLRAVI